MLRHELFASINIDREKFGAPVVPRINVHAGLLPMSVSTPPITRFMVAHGSSHCRHVKHLGNFVTIASHVFWQKYVI